MPSNFKIYSLDFEVTRVQTLAIQLCYSCISWSETLITIDEFGSLEMHWL